MPSIVEHRVDHLEKQLCTLAMSVRTLADVIHQQGETLMAAIVEQGRQTREMLEAHGKAQLQFIQSLHRNGAPR